MSSGDPSSGPPSEAPASEKPAPAPEPAEPAPESPTTPEPVPASESAREPAETSPAPAREPSDPEPATEPATEPVPEAVPEPAPEPAREPTPKPAPEPAPEPADPEPAPAPAPARDPASEPAEPADPAPQDEAPSASPSVVKKKCKHCGEVLDNDAAALAQHRKDCSARAEKPPPKPSDTLAVCRHCGYRGAHDLADCMLRKKAPSLKRMEAPKRSPRVPQDKYDSAMKQLVSKLLPPLPVTNRKDDTYTCDLCKKKLPVKAKALHKANGCIVATIQAKLHRVEELIIIHEQDPQGTTLDTSELPPELRTVPRPHAMLEDAKRCIVVIGTCVDIDVASTKGFTFPTIKRLLPSIQSAVGEWVASAGQARSRKSHKAVRLRKVLHAAELPPIQSSTPPLAAIASSSSTPIKSLNSSSKRTTSPPRVASIALKNKQFDDNILRLAKAICSGELAPPPTDVSNDQLLSGTWGQTSINNKMRK